MANQEPSALGDAAFAFDAELATYARLGKLFLETPLSSVKHLERANTTLAEIAAAEARLQAAGQRLVQTLAGVRDRQEQLAKDVVAQVTILQSRNRRLQDLMTELGSVAGEVASLNDAMSRKAGSGDTIQPPTPADARDASFTVLALSDRAQRLAGDARDAEFEELHDQAHALHQRLQAIGTKLQKVGGD